MAIPALSRLEAHPTARAATPQNPPQAIEAVRPGSTGACPLSNTVPAGYTVIEFYPDVSADPASALVADVSAPPAVGQVTHWRFVFLTSSEFGVGFALNYGDGYAQKAQYLNASNGALCGKGLKQSQWVPSFARAGAQVDFMLEVMNNRLKAYIVMDGVPRGLAFDLDFAAAPNLIRLLKPTVICTNRATHARIAVIQYAAGMPSDAYKYRTEGGNPTTVVNPAPVNPAPVNPACPTGEYSMGPEQFPGVAFPVNQAKLYVGPHGELSFKVFNSMSNGARLLPGGTIGGIQHQMVPPPQFQASEKAVYAWMGTLKTWGFYHNFLTLNDKDFALSTAHQTVAHQGMPHQTATHPIVTDNDLV